MPIRPSSFDEPLSPSEVEGRSVGASFDLEGARAKVDFVAHEAGLERWTAVLPAFEFGVAGMREPDGEGGFGPAIGMSLPLFDQGQAQEARGKAALRSALHHYWDKAVRVRAQARRLSAELGYAEQRESYLASVYLPLRNRVVTETVKQYNAMQIPASRVLAERAGELAAEREHLMAKVMTAKAKLNLLELLAGGPGGENSPMGASQISPSPMQEGH